MNDEILMKNILDIIKVFCECVGLKININKIECILLGDMKNEFEEFYGIKVINKVIKCLGIYVGYDKEECYNKNWMRIYYDMEKLFEFWKWRKLIFFGKVCIIWILVILKFVYILLIFCFFDSNFIKRI